MNLVLVGFMASGKTTVGRRLAQRLGYGFLDTDQYLEAQLGCSVADLFAIQGEEYFRRLESRIAERLHKLENTVIATGGGMMVTPGNLAHLRRAGAIVFLNASREDLLRRLERDTRRPKVRGGELQATVERLMAERLPVYEQSDIVVQTRGKSINRVCAEIIRRLGELPPRGEEASPGA